MPSMNRSSAQVLSSIGKSLKEELIDESNPSLARCQELIDSLQEELGDGKMTIAVLQKSQIGITLGKAVKAMRRQNRQSGGEWATLMDNSQGLLTSWKEAAKIEGASARQHEEEEQVDTGDNAALPTSVAVYRARLTGQSKGMYKDPPVLPPPSIAIETDTCPLPKRDKATGMLTFKSGKDEDLNTLLRDFRPNRTPEEVLRAGSFGGTYFRPITSAVTNIRYNPKDVLRETVETSWIEGLDGKMLLTSSTYRPQVNKYGVKCGGSLGMWESSGWIADSDPYGWFQWYCRFYRGRRCSDDARQISRWLKSAGPKGRFRSQLCNKISAANTRADDPAISPVIRQTLLHWGLEITTNILEQHKKRIGG